MKVQILGLVVAVAVSSGACSDTAGGNGGLGGNSGNHGGGGGNSLPAQGAVSLFLGPSTDQSHGEACPESGTTYGVGAPQAPSTNSPGDSVVDGETGAVISCSVQGSGSFAFSGSLHGTSTADTHGSPITVAFTNGNIAADGTGTATVSVFTPTLANSFTSAEPCLIQTINHQVKGGSLWAEFSCNAVKEPPTGSCVARGVVVFENCDGS